MLTGTACVADALPGSSTEQDTPTAGTQAQCADNRPAG